MTARDADLFAAAVIKMEGAITWDDLEVVCRQLDARYEAPDADPDLRRAYSHINSHHAKRVARTIAA